MLWAGRVPITYACVCWNNIKHYPSPSMRPQWGNNPRTQVPVLFCNTRRTGKHHHNYTVAQPSQKGSTGPGSQLPNQGPPRTPCQGPPSTRWCALSRPLTYTCQRRCTWGLTGG